MSLDEAKDYTILDGAPARLAYPIEQVPVVSGVRRTKIFEAIRDGHLMARKIGRSTIIEHAELVRFLASLPIRGKSA